MEAATNRIASDLAWPTLLGFPESIVLLDATNKVQLVNLAALKTLGHAPDLKKSSWELDQIFARREDVDQMLAELRLRGSYETAESAFTMESGAELRASCKATA